MKLGYYIYMSIKYYITRYVHDNDNDYDNSASQ
jgi:hypothetical protein